MNTVVTYKNRTIDLWPYFEGFPYLGFQIDDHSNVCYYFHRAEKLLLHQIPLQANPDFENGKKISDLDFNTFTAWDFAFDLKSESLFFTGDECNDEKLNIYQLFLSDGSRKKLTDEEYIYGKELLDHEQRIVFIGRKNTPTRMLSTLKNLDLETGQIQNLLEDTPEWTFTWTTILYHPASKKYFFCVKAHFDRNLSNILEYDSLTGKTRILLPENIKRSTFGLMTRWLDPDTLGFISDESGFANVYTYHVPTGSIRAVTQWTEPVGAADLWETDGKKLFVLVKEHPVKDRLYIIDYSDSRILYEEEFPSKVHVGSRLGIREFMFLSSVNDPFSIWELKLEEKNGDIMLLRDKLISNPPHILKQITHGRGEPIQYSTFDIDSRTQTPRMIHAFVFIPENIPENPSDRRAVITAFYGGDNVFSKQYQIFLDAGFIVMSPAVRGSWGLGAEFYSLNDRDLGGNEIIDLIYAGRYLTSRFGLQESQIGLMGGSHGGYCAIRGLTFPAEVNGRRESFQWGFAISSYGISNIVDYYKTCNIPDWVLQKAGDPATEHEKLMDRSPIRHAHRATGPLLLVHGVNDNRVPVDQSRQMAAAMKQANKPFTYIEIEGQGHGWQGLKENIRYFQEVFRFLNCI